MGVEALEGKNRGCILRSLDMEIGDRSLAAGDGARWAHDSKVLISKMPLLWHFDACTAVDGARLAWAKTSARPRDFSTQLLKKSELLNNVNCKQHTGLRPRVSTLLFRCGNAKSIFRGLNTFRDLGTQGSKGEDQGLMAC